MDKKIDINHFQDLNNIRKPILNGSRTNFAQNRILKKKLPNLPKNTENPRFFEFQTAINWPELAQIGWITYQKFRLALYFYQKKNRSKTRNWRNCPKNCRNGTRWHTNPGKLWSPLCSHLSIFVLSLLSSTRLSHFPWYSVIFSKKLFYFKFYNTGSWSFCFFLSMSEIRRPYSPCDSIRLMSLWRPNYRSDIS